jgi:hypothetical protein
MRAIGSIKKLVLFINSTSQWIFQFLVLHPPLGQTGKVGQTGTACWHLFVMNQSLQTPFGRTVRDAGWLVEMGIQTTRILLNKHPLTCR